jgi:hypothetical protein
LLAVAMLALLAFPVAGARADEAEGRAIRTVERLGGEATRDAALPGKPVTAVSFASARESLPPLSGYLEEFVPGGTLGPVWQVWPPPRQVTDADLRELAAFKQLRQLNLSRTQVTDGGLKRLASLNELEMLNLSRTGVTDKGVKELAALQRLRELDLSRTEVTGEGVKGLARLKRLEKLNLQGTSLASPRPAESAAGAGEALKALSAPATPGAEPRRHRGDGRGAERAGRHAGASGVAPLRHGGNRRRPEGVGGTPRTPDTVPGRHGGGRGA